MNCGLNKNSGIQFADQENIIIDSNIVQIQPHVPTWHYFRFSSVILNFRVKESPDKVNMGTIEKLTLENMGITFGILSSQDGTEPEIHLGGSFTPPPNCNVRFKKYHCSTRLKYWKLAAKYPWIYGYFLQCKRRQCDDTSSFVASASATWIRLARWFSTAAEYRWIIWKPNIFGISEDSFIGSKDQFTRRTPTRRKRHDSSSEFVSRWCECEMSRPRVNSLRQFPWPWCRDVTHRPAATSLATYNDRFPAAMQWGSSWSMTSRHTKG